MSEALEPDQLQLTPLRPLAQDGTPTSVLASPEVQTDSINAFLQVLDRLVDDGLIRREYKSLIETDARKLVDQGYTPGFVGVYLEDSDTLLPYQYGGLDHLATGTRGGAPAYENTTPYARAVSLLQEDFRLYSYSDHVGLDFFIFELAVDGKLIIRRRAINDLNDVFYSDPNLDTVNLLMRGRFYTEIEQGFKDGTLCGPGSEPEQFKTEGYEVSICHTDVQEQPEITIFAVNLHDSNDFMLEAIIEDQTGRGIIDQDGQLHLLTEKVVIVIEPKPGTQTEEEFIDSHDPSVEPSSTIPQPTDSNRRGISLLHIFLGAAGISTATAATLGGIKWYQRVKENKQRQKALALAQAEEPSKDNIYMKNGGVYAQGTTISVSKALSYLSTFQPEPTDELGEKEVRIAAVLREVIAEHLGDSLETIIESPRMVLEAFEVKKEDLVEESETKAETAFSLNGRIQKLKGEIDQLQTEKDKWVAQDRPIPEDLEREFGDAVSKRRQLIRKRARLISEIGNLKLLFNVLIGEQTEVDTDQARIILHEIGMQVEKQPETNGE